MGLIEVILDLEYCASGFNLSTNWIYVVQDDPVPRSSQTIISKWTVFVPFKETVSLDSLYGD